MQGPEIQQMYALNIPVSTIRTKIRQEFERHRYVNQLRTVDVLLFHSHQEFQVRMRRFDDIECRTAHQNAWSSHGSEWH